MIYLRKVLRDLRAQKGQVFAVLVVTALGVMLFVASAGAYRDLRDSYATTRSRLALARLHVDMTRVTSDDVATARRVTGVETVEARAVVDIPVSRGDQRGLHATLRVLSIPDAGEPSLDRLFLLSGALPTEGQVLLEKHFAEHHGLKVGDELRVGDGPSALRVAGVAVSPEYLWVTRDATDFMPSPDQFGVGWVRRGSLRALAQELLESSPRLASPALLVAASDDPGTQLLAQTLPSAHVEAVITDLRQALGDAHAPVITKSEDLVGVKLLQLDVDGYREIAGFFPFFFLGVGAFIVGSALARLVDAQQSIIGTLMALGVGRPTILAHYLFFAFVLGALGSVVGAVAGLVLGPQMTHAYASELSIPFVMSPLHLDLLATGIGMGVAVALVAGMVPAMRAMRLVPADAMRSARPRVGRTMRVLRSVRLPIAVSMGLRGVLARPLRSFGTSLGVAAAVVLVLSTGALVDSMKMTFSSLFDLARRYEVRVDFAVPVSSAEVSAKARQFAGVQRVEPCLVVPARLETASGHDDVMLQALSASPELLRSVDANGAVVPPSTSGLTLTRAVAKKLHLGVGDAVTVTPVPRGPALVLRVTGFADAAMGDTANVRVEDVASAWHLEGSATSFLVETSDADAARVQNELAQAFPEALRVEDANATRTQFDEMMGLGWVMLVGMLGFGSVLAAAILFNAATLTILERQRELATLRALGLTMREVATALTVEHAMMALVGLAIGLPLAVGAAKLMLRSFSSNLFALPFVLAPVTVAITLGGVFIVVLLAQWPALRTIARANLADSVRVREG